MSSVLIALSLCVIAARQGFLLYRDVRDELRARRSATIVRTVLRTRRPRANPPDLG